jgi:hypothetical protein
MGSILLPARLRPPAPGPYEAHEVGSVGGNEAAVMVVGQCEPGGPPLYQGEFKGHLWFYRRSYGTVRWIRMELRVPRGNEVIKEGHHLVLAEHPYSNGWLHRTPFKPPYKKGRERREELLVEARRQGNADGDGFIRWIEALPYDFWEKGPFLTAGISGPDMPPGDGGSREISWKAKARLVLGTCRDFDACLEHLWESDEIKELLRLTERNEIRFWSREAKLTVKPKLCHEVIDEASTLMHLSISQALAGPHVNCERYVGRPVTVKVDHIYREHLNRLNRQINREGRRRRDHDDEMRHIARGGRRRAGRLRRHDDDSP